MIHQEDGASWGVLVNMDTAASVALNPTGCMIWKLVDGKRSSRDIASAFIKSFQDAPHCVYDLDGAALINPTGRLIWEILVLPRTVEEISNLLAETLNIPDASVVAKDVEEFLTTLQPDYILVDGD